MSVKKTKGKGKGRAKKSGNSGAPKSTPTKKGKDIVQVRESINEMVKGSARVIAREVIKVARRGQLASARYLFEAVGLYPPTEQTVAPPIETTLAHTLLTRMGLPLEPVINDGELVPPAATSDAKGAATKAIGLAEEDPGGERKEEQAVPAGSEQQKLLQ